MSRGIRQAPADRYSPVPAEVTNLGARLARSQAFLALGQSLIAYALAVAIAMWLCWTLNMASASRLAGITATIILLVPHTGTPERMVLSRVGWGVCAAVCTVWVAARFLHLPRSQH